MKSTIKETENRELIEKINRLKIEREAIILAHNYQLGEIQDIGDFVGDSLELSQKAAKTDAKVIVFCGVHFMAETAKILSPDKVVLLPDINAGCPMADMIDAEKLRTLKKEHPDAIVVCYVNSTAEVKAESDYCCTSANAIKILKALPADRKIIFIPDQYLGSYAAEKAGREVILYPGFCPTHARILARDVIRIKEEFPDAKVVVHPESRPEVIALADCVASTSGIVRFARESEAKKLIIGTEIGIIHRLKKENPAKTFIPITEQAICPNMKLITLEKVLWALSEMKYEIIIDENIRKKALQAVEKMISIV